MQLQTKKWTGHGSTLQSCCPAKLSACMVTSEPMEIMIAIRAVESLDGMSAAYSKIPHKFWKGFQSELQTR